MAMTLITTNDFSGSSAVNFTSDIDSTYKLYIFNIVNWNVSGDGSSLRVNFRDGSTAYDASKTTTVFLASLSDNGSTDAGTLAYKSGYDLAASTSDQIIGAEVGSAAEECASGQLWLFNPSNTTYVKHFYSDISLKHPHTASVEAAWHQFTSGFCDVTAAIDGVQFNTNSGTMTGRIKMYGVG